MYEEILNQFAFDMNYPPGVDQHNDPAGPRGPKHHKAETLCMGGCGKVVSDETGYCSAQCELNEEF
jgi:hypothetical protein